MEIILGCKKTLKITGNRDGSGSVVVTWDGKFTTQGGGKTLEVKGVSIPLTKMERRAFKAAL